MDVLSRAAFLPPLLAALCAAQSTNPDLSALGQVLVTSGDQPGWGRTGSNRLTDGEAELVLDAPLNPYAHGAFVVSIGKDGAGLEEGWASLDNGLPWGLAVKGGRFRQSFGALNPVHSHAYPFIDAPRLLDPRGSGYLPGVESFDDVGLVASELLPLGSTALTLEGGALGGDAFMAMDTSTGKGSHPAWIARASASGTLGEATPFVVGLSGTGGTLDDRTGAGVLLLGLDARTKIPLGAEQRLVLASEAVFRQAEGAIQGAAGRRCGAYGYADFQSGRWNGGLLVDAEQPISDGEGLDKTFAVFGGFKLFEETTLFRLKFERFVPGAGAASDAVKLQVLYSMGPHKPHSF